MALIHTTRPKSLSNQSKGSPALARGITGTIAADSATRTGAQFSPLPFSTNTLVGGATAGQSFNATRYDTLLLAIEVASGSGQVAIEPLFYDDVAAIWLQYLQGSPLATYVTPLFGVGAWIEVPTLGHPTVLFRVNSVSGGSTLADMNILALPGQPRLGSFS